MLGIMMYVKLLSFFICLLMPAASALAGERVVLVSNEYLPYVSTSSREQGVITEIVVAAFAEADVEVEIRFRPWRRCAMLVEDGAVFGAFPYGITEKRKKYAWFSDEIWKCRNVFFYLKGRHGEYDFTSLEAMRGYVIAGTSGNYYEEIFEQAGMNVDYAPGEASGIRKVWEMRTDMFAEDELVGWTLIRRIFPRNAFMFASTPTPWNVNPQTIMVSKKYPGARELLARFNAGLKAIRASGVYGAIVEKYNRAPSVQKP